MTRRGRRIGASVLVLAALAALLVASWPRGGTEIGSEAGPHATTREERAPDALAVPPRVGRGDPVDAPAATDAARRLVRVNVRVTTGSAGEPGISTDALVYWGTTEAEWTEDEHTAVLPLEVVTPVDVPPGSTRWGAVIKPSDPWASRYDRVSVVLDALTEGADVTLVLPRGDGAIRVFAHDKAGAPVAGVGVRLRGGDTREEVRITGADGQVAFEGLAVEAVRRRSAVDVEAPPRHLVIDSTGSDIVLSPDPRRAERSIDVLVERCTSGIDVRVPDLRFAGFRMEEIVDGESKPTSAFPARDPPTDPSPDTFADDWVAVPGFLRAGDLCQGRYRVSVTDALGFYAPIDVRLSAGGRVVLEPTLRAPVRLAGRVTGPAAGVARLLTVRVKDDERRPRFEDRRTLVLSLRRDGTFDVRLPSDVREVRFGEPVPSSAHLIVPRAYVVADDVRVESVTPGSISGRVVDRDGRPVWGVGLSATHEAGARGDFGIESGIYRTGVTAQDGSFRLSPALPGSWHVTAERRGSAKVVRFVDVSEGTVTDLGDIVIE